MVNLTQEERALLAAAERPRRGRPPRRIAEPAVETVEPEVEPEVVDRGPITPAQYDDDGWGDLPVQMRG